MTSEQLHISPDVLVGIAQLAIDDIDGLRTINPPIRMGEILTRRRARGIRIEQLNDGVYIDLTVAVQYGKAVPVLAAKLTRTVRETVSSMTGLTVQRVNVHVDSVDILSEDDAAEE